MVWYGLSPLDLMLKLVIVLAELDDGNFRKSSLSKFLRN